MSNWVVVGAEVVERTSGWSSVYRYGAPRKIGKVYKNGNFVLEGETQQWSVRGDQATRTGEGRIYGSSYTAIVPLSEAVRADMEQAARYHAAVVTVEKEAKRLDLVRRSRDVEQVIAEAAKIEARSK